MTEPLGRSQVIPYLERLAVGAAKIEIVAFEPPGTSNSDVEDVRRQLSRSGIGYTPLRRSKSPRLSTKIAEIARLVVESGRVASKHRPEIVHCRSYLPTAAGDALATLIPDAKLLFDCRGMLGDEYVDARHWTREDIRFRLVKRMERRFFERADGVVVLTEALARWLRKESLLGAHTKLTVVPCCVDTERFVPDLAARERGRAALGIEGPVIVYSGTLGSWYREEEMAAFVAAVHRRDARVRFHVLTRADASALRGALTRHGFPESNLLCQAVRPDDMPAALVLGDIGLSFIQPCFSKIGSSPTKLAEYLACGLVGVANEGIGDVAELANESSACVTLADLEPARIEAAADRALSLLEASWRDRSSRTVDVAHRRFGLAEVGAPRYLALYEGLAAQRR